MAAVADWSNFFVAVAGAAAALTGLVFVSVSISLSRILEFPRIAILALESLALFAAMLLVSLLGLVPQQTPLGLGLALLPVALLLTGLLVRLARQQLQAVPDEYRAGQWRYVLGNFTVVLVLGIAVGCLLAGRPAGCYWLVPTVLLAFGKGLLDAWVVLLEVHR